MSILVKVAPHATSHEDTGVDEIGVGALSGLLGDDQHVLDAEVLAVASDLAHAARHESGGGDPMAVDAVVGTGSLRTLGGGAQQAMPGDAAPAPGLHADTHAPQTGGDPLVCAAPGAIDENASAEGVADDMARSDHNHQHTAALHENGGGAEISVAALSGLLADDQHVLVAEVLAVASALVHAARHQNGGADEISAAALSGLLADDQHVLDVEVLAVASDLAHHARHESGGGDPMAVDAVVGTGSLRTLGGGAQQAMPGDAITHGTFAGDHADERAIPHGLGVTPVLVLIITNDLGNGGVITGTRNVNFLNDGNRVVTDWNATNFYVSNLSVLFNQTGDTYTWVAFA